MKRNLNGSRILLTGASSGIGRALAKRLTHEGARLIVTARREAALHSLEEELKSDRNGEIVIVVGDVTFPETRASLIRTAEERFGGLDALINNAGVGATERVEETSEETARRLLEINYFAPLFLTRAALPLLKKSASDPDVAKKEIHPIVVNLGSIVGLRGTPHYGVYGSAKAALITLTDALRAELAGDGIDFLTVCPGTTRTEFFDVLLENKSMPKFPPHRSVPAEVVAEKIVRAMKKGTHRIIPHAPSRILDRLQRLSPGLVDSIMASFR